MLLSHPEKALVSHLANVKMIGNKLLEDKVLNFRYCTGDRFHTLCNYILMLHDIGKATIYFQEYITDIQNNIHPPRYDGSYKKDHGLLSGMLAFVIIKKLMDDVALAYIAFVVICSHHGNLSDFNNYASFAANQSKVDMMIEQFRTIPKQKVQAILQDLDIDFDFLRYADDEFHSDIQFLGHRKMQRTIKGIYNCPEQDLQIYLFIQFLFSITIYADKLDASIGTKQDTLEWYLCEYSREKEIDSCLVEDYKATLSKKNADLLKIREGAYHEVLESIRTIDLQSHRIFSVNLPTGSGKTLTALKTALTMRERIWKESGQHARVIYVLPFTSVIDQNHKVFADVLKTISSEMLLKHHHLSQKTYHTNLGEMDDSVAEQLVETWESEVVVSSFVQLLHSILTNQNRTLKKLHNIANSILILDEVQNIKSEYWPLVKRLFIDMAKYMNCYILLMTATMPLIFSEEAHEIIELAKNKERYFKALSRITLDTKRLVISMTVDEFCDFIKKEIIRYEDKSFLIVMNTIKSSMEVFEYISKNYKEPPVEMYYLSTNIIPLERLSRIDKIKKSNARKIVVSTQMVEAGVDIDLDRVYRDFAPIDSIIQSAGRCNREGGKSGVVTLVHIVNEAKNKALYRYIYDQGLCEATDKVLDEGPEQYAEEQLFDMSKNYYQEIEKIKSSDQGEEILDAVRKLEFEIIYDKFHLIDPKFKAVEIFIELNEKALVIWQKYQKVIKIKDKFEMKREFNKMKQEFLGYVINIPEIVACRHKTITDGYIHVSMAEKDGIYKDDTGFIRGEAEDYFF